MELTMKELEVKLIEATTELKTFTAKAGEDIKSFGAVTTETKAAVENLATTVKSLQAQADALDLKFNLARMNHAGGDEQKSIADELFESEQYAEAKAADFMSRKRMVWGFKRSAFGQKATVTTGNVGTGQTSSGTTGVQMPQRLQMEPIVLPTQALRIRDVMNVIPMTTGNSFDYIREVTRATGASPQVEGSAKAESTMTFTAESGTIKTIAHFANVSRQALADIPWMRRTIDRQLIYGLKEKEEAEILSGDGTGEHLDGIITQATAYSPIILNAGDGYTFLDVLRDAKLQARLAGKATFAPNAFVLHPTDLAKLEILKTSDGIYIIGNPRGGTAVTLVWGLPVVESDSIVAGTFVIGAFDTGATLIDRMAVNVEISYEHNVNFTSNLATILCEERIGLAVTRPEAFITGSFQRSPA